MPNTPTGSKEDPIHIKLEESIPEAVLGTGVKTATSKGVEKLMNWLFGDNKRPEINIVQNIEHQNVERIINIQKNVKWWVALIVFGAMAAEGVFLYSQIHEAQKQITTLQQKAGECKQ